MERRIALGRMAGALLVPHQDVLDALLGEDGVIDRKDRAAGIAERCVSTPWSGERAEYDLGAGQSARPRSAARDGVHRGVSVHLG